MRSRRLKFAVALAGISLAALTYRPAVGAADKVDHAAEYQACMALAESEPRKAYESGLAWFEAGGGFAARHCIAVALLHLGQFAEAAARLERLASDMGPTERRLLVDVLVHAAQAWYLAGRPDKALKLQSAVIEIFPDDADLRIDRAVTLMEMRNFKGALDDLDGAVARDGRNRRALLYRAVVRRELDRLGEARADIDRAIALDPDDPEVLLERGILRQLDGDLEGARADWLRASAIAGDGPTGEAARARIEEMDVRRR